MTILKEPLELTLDSQTMSIAVTLNIVPLAAVKSVLALTLAILAFGSCWDGLFLMDTDRLVGCY